MGQVLHGSATTTEAIRRAIQHSQASLRTLAKRYGINQKTVAKWKGRTSAADLPTGPREPRSTVLSVEEEAVVVAFPERIFCVRESQNVSLRCHTFKFGYAVLVELASGKSLTFGTQGKCRFRPKTDHHGPLSKVQNGIRRQTFGCRRASSDLYLRPKRLAATSTRARRGTPMASVRRMY